MSKKNIRDLLDWSKKKEDEIEERKNSTDYVLYGVLGTTVILPFLIAGGYSMYNRTTANNATVDEINPDNNLIEYDKEKTRKETLKERRIKDYYSTDGYTTEEYTTDEYTPKNTPRNTFSDTPQKKSKGKDKGKGKGKGKARH